MDIEQLSKSQIVLLTLLVSFVTSIATGIVTVSLVEQAPPALTQTVNRVIERTVERVVPGQAAAVVTTEKTVVVKESDLIVEAVGKITPSIVRIYANVADPTFLGIGIILDESGSIATDSTILGNASGVIVALADGTRLQATTASHSAETGLAILRAATSTSEGTEVRLIPAVISTSESSLGQTVVVLSGRTIPRIADGIVTALIPRGEGEDSVIDTNVSSDFVMQGSPLVDTQGGLLGVSTHVSRASSQGAFIPASFLVPSSESESQEGSAVSE